MEGSVVEWVRALASTDKSQRAAAAAALARSTQPLSPAIVPLVLAAGQRDDETRMWAADALETAGPPAVADVQRLVAVLATPAEASDGESAYWAAKLLGRLGPAAAAATAALAKALEQSPYLAVREQAATALGRIGPAAAASTPVLQQAAGESSPRLVRLALAALESIRGMAA
ncbi:HEAT repeat domain-containing protein [Roseimaritima ulvae]|uniref:HEAT repeat protein n=1 Tax=Roseimaritima ulvae TaxID=980254 RepID=A0A5B9QKP7_9BACT|nr:HEAT repeat domain-containing protein [Roseimaritima ulvae]QEG39464.1 hypothetical protein UC8_14590 [Roseimaritima ulvae]